MTKNILLSILLFSNFAISKQTYQQAEDLLMAELSTTKEIVNRQMLEWETKFYQSLIEDEDPDIKLIGYSKRISMFKGLDKQYSLSDVASEINYMIEKEDLSDKSLATIEYICSDERLKPHCNHEAIFNRQIESMPDNAYIYMNSLNLVYEDNNEIEIKQAIHDIAQSSYVDSFMYLHEGYREKLEDYVKENPFPKNKLALEKLYIDKYGHLSDDEQENITGHMQDIMLFTMVIGEKLSVSIPGFRDIIQVCKNNLAYAKNCLKIADLYINKSKIIIAASVGYAIKIDILKQQGKLEESVVVEKQKTKYKHYYGCLDKTMNYGSIFNVNTGVKFIRIADPIERKFGEIAFFETLAQLNYDYYSKLGNEKIKNPKNCSK
jgi:hypothetical protein